MDIFKQLLLAFLGGGVICMAGQILINKTKITSSKILVIFLLLGVGLEITGLFQPLKNVFGAGVTVPIMGFGSVIVKGAIEGAEKGLFGALTGGLAAASAGLSAAIFFGFIMAIIFKTHSKT